MYYLYHMHRLTRPEIQLEKLKTRDNPRVVLLCLHFLKIWDRENMAMFFEMVASE